MAESAPEPPEPPVALDSDPAAPSKTAPGLPDPATEDEDATRARGLFERAANAFSEKRNMEAIYLFRQAAELMPDPRFSYNLGLAYEDMGHTGEALAAYRDYLRDAEAGPESGDVARRVRILERKLAGVGLQQISVQTQPPRALVFVDGIARGVTPLRLEIPPGSHELWIRKPHFQEHRVVVELHPDHSSAVRQRLVADPPASPQKARGPVIQPLTWALLGVGAAGLVGGVSFELSRASLADRANQAGDSERAASLRGEARGKKTASLSLLGFGAGLLVAGGVLMLTDSMDGDTDPEDMRLSGYLGPDGAGLSAALGF